jgi:NAD(P)H dehydrogenase (quinone)
MRILLVYANPNPASFGAALRDAAEAALVGAGHRVNCCDLYAEGFDPVMSLQERVGYHDLGSNRTPVEQHVRRLEEAEGLVLVFPVWNFGFPAILKGYFDRVFLPGVSFRMENGRARPNLLHLRLLGAVATYGGPRWRALLLGDPPRRTVGRVLRAAIAPRACFRYLAHYDMNRSTPTSRMAFLDRVSLVLGRV